MKILAIESSAKAASVAVCDGVRLIGQFYQNNGLTHSRTVMPMAEELLKSLGMCISEIDCIAVTCGPGSFTGVRIGVAAAKGLAWGGNIPCCGVSSLAAAAQLVCHMDGILCPVMDARREQVYNALFTGENGGLKRLAPDRVISLKSLAGELEGKRLVLVGDGAEMSHPYLAAQGINVILAPEHLRHQSAYGAALAAQGVSRVSCNELNPVYLRLSQAERERQEKMLRSAEA